MIAGDLATVLSSNWKYFRICLLASSLMLVACEGDRGENTSAGAVSTTSLSLPLPERIRAVSALDPTDVSAEAIVNGVTVPMVRAANGSYSGSLQVAAQSSFPVVIEFSEQFAGQKLILATDTRQVSVASVSTTINIRRADYDFDSHDEDGDSVSNIVEREQDSDPFDPSQTPDLITVNVSASQPLTFLNSGFDDYVIEATVGNETRVLTAAGSLFSGAFQVSDTQPLDVAVQVIESVTGQRLEVASQSRVVSNLVDGQEIEFESGGYSTPDRDGDGQSDLAELVAGTDITVNGDVPVNDVPFTINFSVPSLIQNPQTVYDELNVNGQRLSLIRNANDFTVTTSGTIGDSIPLQLSLLDVFNNQPFVVASVQQPLQLASSGQVFNLSEADFDLQIDTDSDGVENYLERQQGSDPFNPPSVSVSCDVTVPALSNVSAGAQLTVDNVAALVDCGTASFELVSSQFGFNWNSQADTVSWQIPATATAGSTLDLPVDVRNPADPNEVYAVLQFRTQVEAAECEVTTSEETFLPSKDVFRNDQRVAGLGPLRLRFDNRQVLIGFDVGTQTGELTSAALRLTVNDDDGEGNVSVFQNDSFVWAESDDLILLPPLNAPIGSLDTVWDEGKTFTIPLTSLFVSGNDVSLILLLDSGSDDVAFDSRELDDPPELVLGFTDCI